MDFESIVEAILRWASEHSVPTVSAHVRDESAVAVFGLEVAQPVTPASVTDALSNLDASLIVLHAPILTRAQYEAALEQLRERGASDEELAEAKDCVRSVGRGAGIQLRVFLRGHPVVFAFDEFAPWFDLMFSPDDDYYADDGYDDEGPADDPELQAWDDRRQDAAARLLAQHDRFPSCRTIASRELLLKEVLGAETPTNVWLIDRLARQAGAIYDAELRPVKKRRS